MKKRKIVIILSIITIIVAVTITTILIINETKNNVNTNNVNTNNDVGVLNNSKAIDNNQEKRKRGYYRYKFKNKTLCNNNKQHSNRS